MLDVRGLHVSYGGIEAVKGIDLTVEAGRVVTLIGANGAGKTTTLRTISGLLRPSRGEIRFEERRIDAYPAHEIVRLGVVHVPEGRHVFPRLTVQENLDLGAFHRRDAGIATDLDRVLELFPVLGERSSQLAGTLSGGEQQMLAMARALMARPRLLMLDEPSMGLSPIMAQRIFATLKSLKDEGLTILLVEQNASAALAMADHAYVLETGRITVSAGAAELLGSDAVKRAYLGGGSGGEGGI